MICRQWNKKRIPWEIKTWGATYQTVKSNHMDTNNKINQTEKLRGITNHRQTKRKTSKPRSTHKSLEKNPSVDAVLKGSLLCSWNTQTMMPKRVLEVPKWQHPYRVPRHAWHWINQNLFSLSLLFFLFSFLIFFFK